MMKKKLKKIRMFKMCTYCSFIKKIIQYPFAQFVALTFPIIYRVGNKAGKSLKWAKFASIGNSFSGILYK